MIQLADRLHFALEARQRLAVATNIAGVKDLDRHNAVQPRVHCAVDRSGAAATDQFQQLIAANVLTAFDQRCGGRTGPAKRFGLFRIGRKRTVIAEQARLLEGRGVDLFMVETFYELDELVAAIDAVRSVSALPIVAVMTFDEDAQTLGGVTAEQAAARLAGLDVAAIGANHGVGLQAALRAIEQMGGSDKPLAVLPNVGLASLAGQRIVFPHATPEYFGEFAAHAQELGARLIGGCCGTTPTEIAAIRAAVDERRRPSSPLVVRHREIALAAPQAEQETELQRKLAALHGVAADRIVLGGGASDILRMAINAFAGPSKSIVAAANVAPLASCGSAGSWSDLPA